MRRSRSAAVLTIAGALIVSAAPAAHHGTLISYDRSKQWTAKAVVTEFRYVNPHAQIFFDVTDEKGTVTHWSGELLANPAQLIRNGWTRKHSTEVLQAGTNITITAAPARAGGQVVLVLKIVSEHGEELLSGGPNAGGPEPPQRGGNP